MRLYFTRRSFLTTGVGALVTAAELRAQSDALPVAGVPVKEFKPRSTVALVAGGPAMFESLQYPAAIKEYKSRSIELVDFTAENKWVPQAWLDQDAHVVPVRLAARFFDPEAFVIGSAMPKSHNYAVVTMSVKNMVLGAPFGTDKAFYHAGFHLIHYNMLVTAQAMQPYWGLAVIDGHEGMEGNGPSQGTPVASKLAIASTDFVAADRQLDWMTPFEVEDGSWIGPRGRRTDRRPPAPAK